MPRGREFRPAHGAGYSVLTIRGARRALAVLVLAGTPVLANGSVWTMDAEEVAELPVCDSGVTLNGLRPAIRTSMRSIPPALRGADHWIDSDYHGSQSWTWGHKVQQPYRLEYSVGETNRVLYAWTTTVDGITGMECEEACLVRTGLYGAWFKEREIPGLTYGVIAVDEEPPLPGDGSDVFTFQLAWDGQWGQAVFAVGPPAASDQAATASHPLIFAFRKSIGEGNAVVLSSRTGEFFTAKCRVPGR